MSILILRCNYSSFHVCITKNNQLTFGHTDSNAICMLTRKSKVTASQRIDHKISSLDFKSLLGHASYLPFTSTAQIPARRGLRSATRGSLVKSSARRETLDGRSVRKWLGFQRTLQMRSCNVPIKMRGMGILQLRCWIPEIRIRRMSKILKQAKASNDIFLMDALNENKTVASEVKRFGRPREKNEQGVPRGLSTAKELYKTVDGYGLMRFPEAVVPNEWLVDGINRIPATQYVNCVKVRSATLFNRLRASRRTPMSNTVCAAICDGVPRPHRPEVSEH